MTDKIGAAGRANAQGCKNGKGASGEAPECLSVYHSCTKPLKFLGKIPRENFPTNGASCWTEQPEQPDYSVIKTADGKPMSWISPDDKKSSFILFWSAKFVAVHDIHTRTQTHTHTRTHTHTQTHTHTNKHTNIHAPTLCSCLSQQW